MVNGLAKILGVEAADMLKPLDHKKLLAEQS